MKIKHGEEISFMSTLFISYSYNYFQNYVTVQAIIDVGNISVNSTNIDDLGATTEDQVSHDQINISFNALIMLQLTKMILVHSKCISIMA